MDRWGAVDVVDAGDAVDAVDADDLMFIASRRDLTHILWVGCRSLLAMGDDAGHLRVFALHRDVMSNKVRMSKEQPPKKYPAHTDWISKVSAVPLSGPTPHRMRLQCLPGFSWFSCAQIDYLAGMDKYITASFDHTLSFIDPLTGHVTQVIKHHSYVNRVRSV